MALEVIIDTNTEIIMIEAGGWGGFIVQHLLDGYVDACFLLIGPPLIDI